MHDLLIKNATIVNENHRFEGAVIINGGKITSVIKGECNLKAKKIIDARGLLLLPGVIDDQVHFREPGLTHKGDIYSESRAAAAGGITSFMEMPNTNPQTTSQAELEKKFKLGAERSLVNYSFYIGATNDNIEEILKTDKKKVCGIKVFMGSSTGNMLVDNPESLKNIFSQAELPVAVHCEDESIVQANLKSYKHKYGEQISFRYHPEIRSEEACYASSSLAVNMANKYGTRLHILHISTAKELDLFTSGGNLRDKQITSEVCVHHLWFNEKDYEKYGARIKWNPAIKKHSDQEGLLKGVIEDKIDIIATDHAPHTVEEKNNLYFSAPSGGPLVQHSLVAMLEMHRNGKISLEKIVEKMCHFPAEIFHVSERGYIREGYWADIVLVDPAVKWTVHRNNILYKCGWSPFEGYEFRSAVHSTFINGSLVYDQGKIIEAKAAKALEFER
ncbi:MAG: dihydroorotase [Bacteroidales bacterium]|nr:dihydroorotase [Bacteroidales bacterium]